MDGNLSAWVGGLVWWCGGGWMANCQPARVHSVQCCVRMVWCRCVRGATTPSCHRQHTSPAFHHTLSLSALPPHPPPSHHVHTLTRHPFFPPPGLMTILLGHGGVMVELVPDLGMLQALQVGAALVFSLHFALWAPARLPAGGQAAQLPTPATACSLHPRAPPPPTCLAA